MPTSKQLKDKKNTNEDRKDQFDDINDMNLNSAHQCKPP